MIAAALVAGVAATVALNLGGALGLGCFLLGVVTAFVALELGLRGKR